MREFKIALYLLGLSALLLVTTIQSVQLKQLRQELKIEQERLIDVQTTCRTYEDEIIRLYGVLEDDKNND